MDGSSPSSVLPFCNDISLFNFSSEESISLEDMSDIDVSSDAFESVATSAEVALDSFVLLEFSVFKSSSVCCSVFDSPADKALTGTDVNKTQAAKIAERVFSTALPILLILLINLYLLSI